MDRFEAREAVRSRLREIDAIEKIEEHPHSVGHCSRCHTVVEPLLSLQWFVIGILLNNSKMPLAKGNDRSVAYRQERRNVPELTTGQNPLSGVVHHIGQEEKSAYVSIMNVGNPKKLAWFNWKK